jgi:hypothetical protein
MAYKKTFWLNVGLGTLFLLALGAASALSHSKSIFVYFLFMYLGVTFVLTAISIKKENRAKLNAVATLLNYITIPIMLFNLTNGGNLMNVFYLGLPSILNLLTLHSIKNNSKDKYQDISKTVVEFIKSNFR